MYSPEYKTELEAQFYKAIEDQEYIKEQDNFLRTQSRIFVKNNMSPAAAQKIYGRVVEDYKNWKQNKIAQH